MTFCITSLSTRIVEHALLTSRIIRSKAGVHDRSRYLTVTLRDADGVPGYGEAATTALWSGEIAETAQHFADQVFAPLLLNHSFDHPREVLALMDKATYGNAFTKSAVDTAVWDLWARSQQMRAVELFGNRKPLESIPTRASVGCYDVEKTVRIATEFWNAGITVLKFKIGVPNIDDEARLRAVRDVLGDAPVFTVDANGAYGTVKEAVTAIEGLAPYNVTLVEQPTPRERIHLLAEVKHRVEVPLLADECVFNIEDLREVLDCDACSFISLYPGKNGGITHTIDMARMAENAGKPCAIGSNLETDLGQAAMACVAAGLSAFPVEQLACDLSSSLFYQSSSVTEPLALEGGRVLVPRGAGFGVEPLEK